MGLRGPSSSSNIASTSLGSCAAVIGSGPAREESNIPLQCCSVNLMISMQTSFLLTSRWLFRAVTAHFLSLGTVSISLSGVFFLSWSKVSYIALGPGPASEMEAIPTLRNDVGTLSLCCHRASSIKYCTRLLKMPDACSQAPVSIWKAQEMCVNAIHGPMICRPSTG